MINELGTFRYFTQDPVGSWRWYLSRFEKTIGAKPNPAHTALVRLEDFCERQGGGYSWSLKTSTVCTARRGRAIWSRSMAALIASAAVRDTDEHVASAQLAMSYSRMTAILLAPSARRTVDAHVVYSRHNAPPMPGDFEHADEANRQRLRATDEHHNVIFKHANLRTP